eukprot:g16266.t1
MEAEWSEFTPCSEPLTVLLAELLRKTVVNLSGQHVANCLGALSRVSLCNEEFASLQAALQARLARRDLHFEPQQLAQVLQALAAIHGDGARCQASGPDRGGWGAAGGRWLVTSRHKAK